MSNAVSAVESASTVSNAVSAVKSASTVDGLAAVLWDMDGTLVDTEPEWMAAETALLARFGRRWTRRQGLALVGSGLEDAAVVLQQHGAELSVPEIIDTLTDHVVDRLRMHVPWRPGALELLA